MKFLGFLGRSAPPPALLEWLLEAAELNIVNGKLEVFDAIRKDLRQLEKAESFVSELLALLARNFNNKDIAIQEGRLTLVETIMRRYLKSIGSFDVFHILEALPHLDARSHAAKASATRLLQDACFVHSWPALQYLRRLKTRGHGRLVARIVAVVSN